MQGRLADKAGKNVVQIESRADGMKIYDQR